MKKILITGANGFLAQSIIDLLDVENNELIALIKSGSSTHNKVFSRAYSDLQTLLINERDFSVIYHIAAYIPYGSMNKPHARLINDNIIMTCTLVNAYPKARFIYASSVAVYGKSDKFPIHIESPFVNPDLYGLSKLAGEAAVGNHSNHAIIRFSSIIGYGMKVSSFIPMIIDKAQKTGVITILGQGSRQQNYIDVRDAASLCVACAGYKENIITLGVGPHAYSNKEVAELVASMNNARIEFTGVDDSPSFSYTLDPAHIRLNFRPVFTLKETIAEMTRK